MNEKFNVLFLDISSNIGTIILIGLIVINVLALAFVLFLLLKPKKKFVDLDITNYQTKYPVILVHGMVLKNFKMYNAFRKIKDVLIDNGVKVYVSNIDGIGTIENNANQLKNEILKIVNDTGCEKVNLIAHSKGGLDSRYMISSLGMDDYVASLTTLSTPHYGSKMSYKLLKLPKFIKNIIAFFVNLFYKIFKDEHPNILKVGQQLTDESMKSFNILNANSSKVYYQSYSSSLKDKKVFIMKIPYEFSKYCENEETDGIVSVSSSKWGEYKGDMPSTMDHANMVGAYGTYKSLLIVSKFYLTIVKELKDKNF